MMYRIGCTGGMSEDVAAGVILWLGESGALGDGGYASRYPPSNPVSVSIEPGDGCNVGRVIGILRGKGFNVTENDVMV